jgi:hypothetical protein
MLHSPDIERNWYQGATYQSQKEGQPKQSGEIVSSCYQVTSVGYYGSE